MSSLIDDFTDIFNELLTLKMVKRKLEADEELTPEEQSAFLQMVYSYAKENLKRYKEQKLTRGSLITRGVSIICSLSGEKYKGIADATKATGIGIRNTKDNYNQLLTGVSMTDKNPVKENFTTLVAQYDSVHKYDGLLLNIMQEMFSRKDAYKKDFATPILEEDQTSLVETREEIISLGKKYV